ncbi:MAG: 16S rRNA (cytidine(1402)-2'-O)-methyltransferase [Gammaproteobacteria bacterium]|jgi:16S rRNA (cytidine1402-2'-O)-methyltransferase|nr:16S rRNA (cytidine(1402)-2'-O)-methyltransferase [Gammaproteobacteria bacterium]MDH3952831.1 16S rRNA (cytidine(1402)-2'-O)-methyltransferase [Gammaproteobacteria bacterium]MDH4005849.1 16S rRNA (cytidine(1402)-2'-O)-methyltransferase [Gammaproteobacteria bacterium]
MSGTLFVVATPIGNLEDLSPRARQTLAEVDLVAAEDTRHTGRLLSHLGLKTRQFALHEHNEARAAQVLIAQLKDGKSVALVSDAGTPLVSDPGYRLVQAAHAHGIAVSPLPGPSAVTAALSVSGLPTDRFGFEGFPPAKQAARRKWLQARADDQRTLLFFEAVHRIAATLADMVDVFGAGRQAFLGRELTKLHEQSRRASLGELLDELTNGTIVSKGEFVIAIHGAGDAPASSIDTDRLLTELAEALPPKKAAAIAARVTGETRNALYKRLLEIKGDGDA